MSYDVGLPWAYNYLTEAPPTEVENRVFLSGDLCIVNNWFFVRGHIEIPVIDTDDTFTWITWAAISRENYARTLRLWDNPERVFERPYKGLLGTEIPGYRKALFLKGWIHSRLVGERPLIELKRTKNKLTIEQQEGMTMVRVQEIAEMMLHGRNEPV